MPYDLLLSPMNIGTLTLRNRTVMTAAEMSMGQPDGTPTERLMRYYEARAEGGVALIIPGICRVNDGYAASSFTQLAMSRDDQIEPMRAFVQRIHRHGARLGIQLHHPGRQGYCSVVNVLPLALPIMKRAPGLWKAMVRATPILMGLEERGICRPVAAPSVCERSCHVPSPMRAMTRREIRRTIRDFVDAAVRCRKAGVDLVELHAAHGYLLQQFLSPNTNKRTDEYGGDFEGRLRFLTEIITGIREVCGRDYPLMVRLTADEMYDRIGQPGKGYALEEGKRIAKRLEELGVDAINVSSACYDTYNYWLEPTSFEPGWRAYLAGAIRETVRIPVVAANLIRSPEQAERQLKAGVQDFIGSARTFICDPAWVKKVSEGRTEEIRRCIGCLHCIASFTKNAGVNLAAGLPGECALNPAVGFEAETTALPKNGAGRRVVVVGAGPAGLKAAEVLALRGFAVTVLEKAAAPGGQVGLAARCIKKDKLFWCVEDLMASVRKLGVDVRFNTEATAASVLAMRPWAVVLAAGGEPLVPKNIPGIEQGHVCTAADVILGKVRPEGKRVVVAGSGMTGLEVTELLNAGGNAVTVVEMAPEVAPGTWFQLVDDEMRRIAGHGTVFLTGRRLMAVFSDHVVLEDVKTGVLETLPAEQVVLALGVRPQHGLYAALRGKIGRLCPVGDAVSSGTIADAVHGAWNTAAHLC